MFWKLTDTVERVRAGVRVDFLYCTIFLYMFINWLNYWGFKLFCIDKFHLSLCSILVCLLNIHFSLSSLVSTYLLSYVWHKRTNVYRTFFANCFIFSSQDLPFMNFLADSDNFSFSIL